MKRYIITFIVVSFVVSVWGQKSSLTIDATQNISTFRFLDSEDNKQNKEYKPIFTSAYSLGYKYMINDNIILRGGLGMRNAGASLVYDEMNYSWKLQYLDVKIGGGYMFNLGKFSPYLIASGYYARLLRGIQIINNEEYNITESEILNPSDVGVIITPGLNFKMNDFISAYLEFNYLLGLYNIEKDENQKGNNTGYGLTLGLSFAITKGGGISIDD